jgi:CHAT domain-containing protein/tetratricopeptide (TPR) repeat protein
MTIAMNKRFRLAVAIMLIGIGSIPLEAQDADELAIRKLVEQTFTAHQKKDLNGVMAGWSEKSAQFADRKKSYETDFTIWDETQFVDVTFTQWKIENARASVRLRYERKWRDARTKQDRHEVQILYVEFVKEAAGWRFWEQQNVGAAFGRVLIRAKTKEERAALLQTHRDLVTTELVTGFCEAIARRVEQSLFEEALRLNEIAFEAAEVLGTDLDKGQVYLSRGFIYHQQSLHPEAQKDYQQALQLFEAAQDKEWRAKALALSAELDVAENKRAEAIGKYEVSVQLFRQINDKEEEVKALNNLRTQYKYLGKYADAFEANRAALKIARDLNEKSMEIEFLLEMGNLYEATSRNAEALDYFKTALQLTRATGGLQADEVKALNNMGGVYKSLGKYAEALEYYSTSLKMSRDMKIPDLEATILHNIGLVYSATGKYEEALEKYNASLGLKRTNHDLSGETATLNSIGNVYQFTERYPEALDQYEQSLKLKQAIDDKVGEAIVLNNIGIVYQLMHKYVKAAESYKAAFKIRQEMGDRVGQSKIVSNLGIIYLLAGDYKQAKLIFDQNLKTMRSVDNPLEEADALRNLGEMYLVQGKWREAADAYRQALPIIELIRTDTKEPSLQAGSFAQHTPPYYGLIESLLELGSAKDEIFNVSERSKARTLVELMTGGGLRVLKSMNEAERKREQALSASIIEATEQLNYTLTDSALKQEDVDKLKRQLNKARDDYEELRRQLFIAHPGLQAQRANFAPLTLAQLGETLFAKYPDLCLLSYVVSKNYVMLFVLEGGKTRKAPATLNIYKLKIDGDKGLRAEELRRRLSEFKLRYTNEGGLYKKQARELYELLLAPVESALKSKGHVAIIPDGMLNGLPFQALIDRQGKHFIESHSISYAPSVTALVQMMALADLKKKNRTDSAPLFAMGRRTFPDQSQYQDSELRRAEEQVISIAALFKVSPLIDQDATEGRAKSEIAKARHVHFATHGELNDVAPMYSGIALGKSPGEDGMLYARELADMDLQAELVVLSACDTGLGQLVSGEGIMGLTWALFVAGTPTSVVTQWKVRDDSMNQLMLEFYRQIRASDTNGQATVTKAESLRRAQLKLIMTDTYKNPYHWAQVTLVGDWR